ncbi:hypothetical protein EW146_g4391 [Bondarzewia mesenterica]|uniref:Uncharacterized protein n=1 Tax=Bondarzewia mesenterica TaxID=1095465 RepID=A0A4S4LUV1_9AGAM|nr:hypothetical protein EW146_g4391 [Bondarzewia mesenterica]
MSGVHVSVVFVDLFHEDSIPVGLTFGAPSSKALWDKYSMNKYDLWDSLTPSSEFLDASITLIHQETDTPSAMEIIRPRLTQLDSDVLLSNPGDATTSDAVIHHNADTSVAPTALVLDSTTGDNDLSSAISSIAPKNHAPPLLAIPIISLLYAVSYAINNLADNSPILKEFRTVLNSPVLLLSIANPTDPKATPRLYVYPKSDRMTVAPKVAAHIEDAPQLGCSE